MSLLAIFVASIIGSPHCAAMCGGFALFCSGSTERSAAASLFYNSGRLATYLLLGTAAGALGAGADSALARSGASGVIPIFLSVLLVALGASQLLGLRIFRASPAPKLVSIAQQGIERIGRCPPALRGALVGCGSTLLPCGWLYSFLLVAAAFGSALNGALTMAVFWAGTVPMMAAVGEISRRFLARWGAQIPSITAALLIAAGLLGVGAHMGIVPSNHHCEAEDTTR